MKRTGEVVLGVIGSIFNVIGIIGLLFLMVGASGFMNSSDYELFMDQMQMEMQNDPNLTAEDAQIVADMMPAMFDAIGVFGWVFLVALIISLILAVIGIVKISKNSSPKAAGALFIVAGIFAGILSLTSILFYIAAIMCFVRKPPVQDEFLEQREPYQTF
ncbi:DUF4064 domain-containing protein [Chungangia koreensis]|uniref:DUF4064 domain-containing protein n=1 Tax=Chungangia koreensis TaxID=752657 RepID=A0ABV8X6D2_9LACT